jgi:SAM-dependent methyltransferase
MKPATPKPSSSDHAARDEATLGFYADEAPIYTASGPGGASWCLDAFLQRLAPGTRILELGCGGGRDSEEMLARGFQLDATDGVQEMAHKAEARIGHPVRVMRFDELDAVEAYDGVWAHASLLHVPRPALPIVLSLIFRALKPGGVHFANFKGGGSEGRDAFGRYYNYLTADEVRAAYRRSAGWDIHAITEYQGGGYDGCQGPWVAITARRPT